VNFYRAILSLMLDDETITDLAYEAEDVKMEVNIQEDVFFRQPYTSRRNGDRVVVELLSQKIRITYRKSN